MGEVAAYPRGAFCWTDLGTPDVAAAKAFYGELLGWEFEDLDAGGQTYTMCRLRGLDVTGIHEHPAEEGATWASYLTSEDTDADTARARELGAEVLMEPFDIPETARMSLLRDPAGAKVALWQSEGNSSGARLVNDIGAWCWNELASPKLDEAITFYGELFGWEAERAEGIPRATFTMGNLLVGGVHAPFPGESAGPRWVTSFAVTDADRAAAEAERLGGSVLFPPMDVPVGRFTLVADPAGAEVTLTAFPGGPIRGVDGS